MGGKGKGKGGGKGKRGKHPIAKGKGKLKGKEMEKGTVVDHSRLFDLPMVRQCLLAAFDPGSRFHALKGNHHLNELLIKKHVLPEAEALSLFGAASKGDLRAVRLVLNWTMTPVDSRGRGVSACPLWQMLWLFSLPLTLFTWYPYYC
jgi:hypothetical protein